MKRFIYLASVILSLFGCGNSEKNDINKCISLFRTAETSKQIDNVLPCGLKFGMNLKEMETQLKMVSRNNRDLQIKGNYFIYKFKANDNIYECNIIGRPSSQNPFDTIAPINEYSLIFDNQLIKFKGEKKDLFNDLKNEYEKWEFASCLLEYTITKKRNNMWHDFEYTEDIYCWTTQNLAILLTDYKILSVTFYNAPETKPSRKLRSIMEEINEIGENEKRAKAARYREKKYKSQYSNFK